MKNFEKVKLCKFCKQPLAKTERLQTIANIGKSCISIPNVKRGKHFAGHAEATNRSAVFRIFPLIRQEHLRN